MSQPQNKPEKRKKEFEPYSWQAVLILPWLAGAIYAWMAWGAASLLGSVAPYWAVAVFSSRRQRLHREQMQIQLGILPDSVREMYRGGAGT